MDVCKTNKFGYIVIVRVAPIEGTEVKCRYKWFRDVEQRYQNVPIR